MDSKKGIFIVIEGTDGSGKGTQLKLVTERLRTAGHQVETFDFPQYDQPSSYFVKRYLNGDYGTADEVGPYTSSLFYALDRFEAAPKIREALRAGRVVIANRFTGSNMAHQGTKIANAEQRRGFFIWLDNLEFEMLGIPRPDISFVLRVPAAISQQLVDQKGQRDYTDKKRDLHEADLSHLERAVTVYDDMTQLFPKDFQRIDCVRGGQLLDVQTINMMLWEKINPLLPPPDKVTSSQSSVISQNDDSQATDNRQQTTVPAKPLVLQNVSGLLAQRIQRMADKADIVYPDVPDMYRPTNLVPDAQTAYDAKANTILGLYAKLVAGLAKHGIAANEARRTCKSALMVAASATVHIPPDEPQLESLIISLLNDTLPEAQTAGIHLFTQVIKTDPGRLKGATQPIRGVASAAVKNLSEEFLSQNHIGDQPAVQLTAVWPRNENDLVADMLYGHGNLPLRVIQDRIATWPFSRKLAVFEAYLSDARPGPALEKAHYSWDILSPYHVFLELQRQPCEGLEIQILTPRYGYDIPPLIEEAGLSETYEKCFDLSLQLYSTLQAAGHQLEAQYATLYGHTQRWQMTHNALQVRNLQQLQNPDPEVKKLLSAMRQTLAETHPTLTESISQEPV